MAWGVFLAAIAGSLAKRVLVALGFGVATFVGVEALKSAFESAIDSSLGGLSSDIYQIFALAGGVDLIGIWLGAITTSMVFMTLKRLMMSS